MGDIMSLETGFVNHYSSFAPFSDQLSTTKTGTTIVGVRTDEFVIMAADSRATMGTIISNKDCLKLHKFADNIWAAGAGTAADLDHVSDRFSGQLKKLRLKENARYSRPLQIVTMLENPLTRYGGAIGM